MEYYRLGRGWGHGKERIYRNNTLPRSFPVASRNFLDAAPANIRFDVRDISYVHPWQARDASGMHGNSHFGYNELLIINTYKPLYGEPSVQNRKSKFQPSIRIPTFSSIPTVSSDPQTTCGQNRTGRAEGNFLEESS